jgi:hypothetical protein
MAIPINDAIAISKHIHAGTASTTLKRGPIDVLGSPMLKARAPLVLDRPDEACRERPDLYPRFRVRGAERPAIL